jgi:hypothetical protein
VSADRLFEPPPPLKLGPEDQIDVDGNEQEPTVEQPSLLDPPVRAVEEAPEFWRSVTAEEEALLSHALPRAGCTLPVGKEVYGALVRIGMRKKHRPLRPSDWFEASRAELVEELRHCEERQTGSYLRVLREGGLVDRQRRRQGSNLWRLPHYRPSSRPATGDRSTDQDRQPITAQTTEGRQPIANPSENSSRENNVVPLSGRSERHHSRRESPSELLREIWGRQ